MTLIEKIKLLFKIRKPAEQVASQLQGIKRGYKTLAFWVSLLGSLISTAAALTGIIPAPVYLIINTVLQTIYNILRGLQKFEDPTIVGTFRTTEFMTTALGELQKGIVVVQGGGINPEWLAVSSTIVGMALAAGQNLAAQQPKPEQPK